MQSSTEQNSSTEQRLTCTCMTLNMSSGWDVMRVLSAAFVISRGCFSMLMNHSMTWFLMRSRYSLHRRRERSREEREEKKGEDQIR